MDHFSCCSSILILILVVLLVTSRGKRFSWVSDFFLRNFHLHWPKFLTGCDYTIRPGILANAGSPRPEAADSSSQRTLPVLFKLQPVGPAASGPELAATLTTLNPILSDWRLWFGPSRMQRTGSRPARYPG
ncbi:hypothetical protein GH714_031542 [Hevea brasiliensis]|uniref:Uncharacterized protein n=1 Tax=Hevea brasiliensis TaxID=3981 RepID=A0A6A6LKS8_HEVBR|nr:hypothetical protein GH714_031542 [Hevea brasiliensis]